MITTGNNQPLVSIIVPVYKAEKYIHQCVDSLLAQTYRNIEVILVDDGSPDRSGAICDEYATADSRVKVIHQQNGGVSVARQTGIDNATGDYSIHADPDDWVEPVMIEELVAKALETGADYTFCDFYEEYNNGQLKYVKNFNGGELSSTHLLELTIADMRNVALWFTLVKVSAARGIRFEPIMNWREDQLFVVKLLNRGVKVAYLSRAFYHYRCDNMESLTHSLTEKHILACLDYAHAVSSEICDRNDLGLAYILSFKRNILRFLIMSRNMTFFRQTLSIFPEIHKILIEEGKQYHWNAPERSCLSVALRGYPMLAYYLYKSNWYFINIKEYLQGKKNV